MKLKMKFYRENRIIKHKIMYKIILIFIKNIYVTNYVILFRLTNINNLNIKNNFNK